MKTGGTPVPVPVPLASATSIVAGPTSSGALVGGQLLLWGASALCAFTAAPSAIAAGALTKLSAVGWLAASAIGYVRSTYS